MTKEEKYAYIIYDCDFKIRENLYEAKLLNYYARLWYPSELYAKYRDYRDWDIDEANIYWRKREKYYKLLNLPMTIGNNIVPSIVMAKISDLESEIRNINMSAMFKPRSSILVDCIK